MNAIAVLLGLLYGLLSVGLCYGVSMVTAGLFARPYYRLYARTLIGTCAVMLAAPGLRLLAIHQSEIATIALLGAQFIVAAIFGNAIVRFNREYLPKVFQERTAATYFSIGTLANASVVTLAFLHVAVTATPGWRENFTGYVSIGNYGPLLLLLAGLVFHTDIHLKTANKSVRNFSRFTFLGYSTSFLGLGLSITPFLARAIGRSELFAVSSPLLQNLFSVLAFFLAILLYAWVIWRYESIPPLYLLLFALIGEYYLLVTQWSVTRFGLASLAIASFPLCVGIYALDQYFSKWKSRKHPSDEHHKQGEKPDVDFARPFRVVGILVAGVLFATSIWARVMDAGGSGQAWTVLTFMTYALFGVAAAFLQRQSRWLYFSATLITLACALGFGQAFGMVATVAIAAACLTFSVSALMAKRIQLSRSWQTPLADCGFIVSLTIIGIAASRHILHDNPYGFGVVSLPDGIALLLAAVSLLISAFLYRSRLPVFASLLAITLIAPPWAAAVSFVSASSAILLKGRVDAHLHPETQLKLFGITSLPFPGCVPSLYCEPLRIAAIPLAIIGLSVATSRVVAGDLELVTLIGVSASACSLLLLAFQDRKRWLYVTAIAASYFAIHVLAHGIAFQRWSSALAFDCHLLLASVVSLSIWSVPLIVRRLKRNHGWKSRRVGAKEDDRNDDFYITHLLQFATAVTTALFSIMAYRFLAGEHSNLLTVATASITTFIFAWSTQHYRAHYWCFLTLGNGCTLAAICTSVLHIPVWAGAASVAGIGFSICNFLLCGIRNTNLIDLERCSSDSSPEYKRARSPAFQLWMAPTAAFAFACSIVALFQSVSFERPTLVDTPLLISLSPTLFLVGATFLLLTRSIRFAGLYVVGLAFLFLSILLACHVTVDIETLSNEPFTADLFVASLQLGISSAFAAILTGWFNGKWKRHHPRIAIRLREFYAGNLIHSVLAVGILGLFAFSSLQFQQGATPVVSLWSLAVGLLLSGTFGLLAVLYRSRIPVYLSLLAFSLTVVTFLHGMAGRSSDLALAVTASFLGLTLGSVSWLLKPRANAPFDGVGIKCPSLCCWSRPPLPMISQDRSLWSIPLAHTSVVSALISLALGTCHPTWWAEPRSAILISMTLFLISAVILIATFTHTIGWGRVFATTGADANQSSDNEIIERSILYTAAVLTFGFACHTSLNVAISRTPIAMQHAMHFALASLLIAAGWSTATALMKWFEHAAMPSQQASETDISNCWLYSGLLQHVTLTIAVLTATFGLPLLLQSQVITSGFATGITILGWAVLLVYFSLAGTTYQSRIPIYLSIGSLVAAMIQGSLLIRLTFPAVDTVRAPIVATVGLACAVTALAIDSTRATSKLRVKLNRLSPPGPREAMSIHGLWVSPLRDAAFLFAIASLLAVVTNFVPSISPETSPIAQIAGILGISSTMLVLAWLYRSPVLTYAGIAILMMSSVPTVGLLGESTALLGSVVAGFAMLLWIAGHLIGRCVARIWRDSDVSRSQLIEFYCQPLVRCSAIFACIAIGHAIWIWYSQGWQFSQPSIVTATGIGAVTLMLNAGSLAMWKRVAWARILVYLACLSVTGCWLAASSMTWQAVTGLGPNAAMTSLVLGLLGWLLVEGTKNPSSNPTTKAASRLTFGEPISHFASCLSIAAVLLAIGTFGEQIGLLSFGRQVSADSAGDLATLGATLLIVAGTCLVSIRTQGVTWWLYAATLCGSLGLISVLQSQTGWSQQALILNWMLLMTGFAAVARLLHQAPRMHQLLATDANSIAIPYVAWPTISSITCVVFQLTNIGLMLTTKSSDFNWPWIPVSVLSATVFLHAAYVARHRFWMHAILLCTLSGLVGWALESTSPISPIIAVAVAGSFLTFLSMNMRLASGKQMLDWLAFRSSPGIRTQHQRDLLTWGAALLFSASLFEVQRVVVNPSHLIEMSVVLWLVTLTASVASLRWKHIPSAIIALGGIAASIGTSLFASEWRDSLLEHSALIVALASFCYLCLAAWLQQKSDKLSASASEKELHFLRGTEKATSIFSHTLAGIAVVIVAISIFLWKAVPSTSIAICVTTLSMLVATLTVKKEVFAYATLLGALASFASVCYLVLDFDFARTAGAAFCVVGYCLSLYLVNVIASRSKQLSLRAFRSPSYYLALVSPIFLAFVIPFDQPGVTSLTLIATGACYLTVAFEGQTQWPLYITALLFNVAVYLWVPAANQQTGLFQLYVIPAAVTVLIFAQLHHRELNHSILTSIRLAANGAILAVSTFEAFFSEETSLLQFLSVLLLSLAGTALGIALRVKPFVYTGISFLILNVVGQLGVQFHDEGGIVRAVILIGVGIVVLGIMIFFNIHRERILRQYRGFLVDESWE